MDLLQQNSCCSAELQLGLLTLRLYIMGFIINFFYQFAIREPNRKKLINN